MPVADSQELSPFDQARALELCGEHEAACRLYRKVVSPDGNLEEVYVSLWRIGVYTGRTEDLLMASVYRPCRLEALVHLCGLLRGRDEWATIYAISRSKRGIPNGDTLLVDASAEWRIVEEHGRAAMTLGCKKEAMSDFRFVIDHYQLPEADGVRLFKHFLRAKAMTIPEGSPQ